MSQWRVSEVMTADVITVHEDTPVAQIAALMAERQVSAVPVVDRFDTVTGVVSWTDLRDTVEAAEAIGAAAGRRWPRFARLRWPHAVAIDVMCAPPVTVAPDTVLAAAGRLMHRRNVGRLLVVDDRRRLMGIVTRGDLFKVHDRPDTVIREEVTQRVLLRTLMIPAGEVRAEVDGAVVVLTGRTKRRTTALAAVALTAAVAGVADVVDGIAYDVDDVQPASKPPAPDPMCDWWHQAASLPVNDSRRLRHPGFDHNPATRVDKGAVQT